MKKILKNDFHRYNESSILKLYFKDIGFRYLYHYRHLIFSKKFFGLKLFHKARVFSLSHKTGIEIFSKNVDEGILLLHPYNITVNSSAKIGKNVTLLKGCTIGSVKEGKKAGVPIIKDNVYIGLNSTIVGNITIEEDVLICANTFVNFDVPAHSIVIGNPAVIHHKFNATKEYINNPI